MRVADEAIRDHNFWAYTSMLQSVGMAVQNCAGWAETCSCHFQDERRRSRSAKMGELRRRVGIEFCPMATMRAPEMVAGALWSVLRRGFRRRLPRLLLEPAVAALPHKRRQAMLCDYSRARVHLLWAFHVKLSCWKQLTWAQWGVAHHDLAVAKHWAGNCFALVADASAEVQRHPLVHPRCSAESPTSRELHAFSNAMAYPVLHAVAAKLRCSTICERWMEGQHAEAKRAFQPARHHGPLHLAWSTIRQPLARCLEDDPEELPQRAACLKVIVRNIQRPTDDPTDGRTD